MTREELKNAAVSAIRNTNNVAIQAATGVGKSRIAMDMCYEIATRSIASLRILLVVAEIPHKANWNEELTLINWNTEVGEITIICYQSLKNFRDTEWDVIIFDEAHHLGSELRLDIFETLKTRYRIFLSATLKDSLLCKLEESCGPILNIKMGLQDAFNADILPEPKIKLIPLLLDKINPTETIVEEWGKKDKRLTAECKYAERWKYLKDKKRIPNGRLIIHCTQQQKYDYLSEKFEFYKKKYMFSRNEALKNKWLQCGSQRKFYLGLLKTEIVKKLLSKVKDKRFICFCTNIEQAEILGGKNAIHSKKKDSLSIIQQFNNKEISNLFAVGMLQEGMNLNDIQVGIIVQLDGEERAFIQKFGRTLRAESPVQYIIYYKGTRDEEYLTKALENIDKKYIKELDKI
jgi:superfamily II DNA or RNA helicase